MANFTWNQFQSMMSLRSQFFTNLILAKKLLNWNNSAQWTVSLKEVFQKATCPEPLWHYISKPLFKVSTFLRKNSYDPSKLVYFGGLCWKSSPSLTPLYLPSLSPWGFHSKWPGFTLLVFLCLIRVHHHRNKAIFWYRKVCMKAPLLTLARYAWVLDLSLVFLWSLSCRGQLHLFIYCQIDPATLALKLGILLTFVANLPARVFYSYK